ncbi:MAG: hypothetical protein OHK0046_09340 [Anaerolineae bacterium]
MRLRSVLALIILLIFGLAAAMTMTTGLFAQGSLPPPVLTQTAQALTPGGGGPPFLTPGGPPFGTPGFGQTPGFGLTPTALRPTVTPTVLAPGCESVFPLILGTEITIRPGVNFRASPSISSAWLGSFTDNRVFTVLDGPVCGDNYVWWQVRGHGIFGWVAERTTQINFIRDFEVIVTPVCATPLVLPADSEVELTTGVRVRAEPNLGGLVLTVAQTGDMATVLTNEVRCSDGYNWRFIQVTVANFTYEGWMVEGGLFGEDEVYIVPTEGVACAVPRNIPPGSQGRIDYRDSEPKNLRDAPGYDSEILFTLVDGIPFEILEGPVCAGGMNWWRVNILSTFPVVGWIAEGPRPNYWFKITNDIGRFSTSTPVGNVPGAATVTPTFTLQPSVTPTRTPTVTVTPGS